MPWHVEHRGDEWCVVKDDDGETVACHDSEAKAKRQLRALYASEGQSALTRAPEYSSFGVGLAKLELHGKGKARTMVGYASAFDYPIPGDFGETIYMRQGMWNKTLQENRDNIQVLFHHGQDPHIGMSPLGVPAKINPDRYGLWTETPLAATAFNEERIVPLLESGALRAMSVQFVAMQDSWNADRTERYVEQAALIEFGPTPFPRNLGASAALHSRQGVPLLGDGIAPAGMGESPAEQAETSDDGTAEGIPDPDRLTWEAQAATALHAFEREQEEWAAWLTQGGTRGNPRADQGPA